jgi:hypothetical protein
MGNKIMPKPSAKPTITTESFNTGPVCVFAVRSRRHAVSNSCPAPCQGFAQASWGLMVARGGRMIAAISIGIIIIVAVIIAALAIIYFVLKGSPR